MFQVRDGAVSADTACMWLHEACEQMCMQAAGFCVALGPPLAPFLSPCAPTYLGLMLLESRSRLYLEHRGHKRQVVFFFSKPML